MSADTNPHMPNALRAMSDLQTQLATARKHTPGGVLSETDRAGIYRSAARRWGLTVDQVREMAVGL